MRFSFILLFLSNFISCQRTLSDFNERNIVNANLTAKPSEFYVDGVKMQQDKTIIHRQNIKDIRKHKGDSSKIVSGAIETIVVVRKKEYEFISLSKFIEALKHENTGLKSVKNISTILDGTIINNINDYQIELNPDIEITIVVHSDDGVYHGGKGNKPKPQILIETK